MQLTKQKNPQILLLLLYLHLHTLQESVTVPCFSIQKLATLHMSIYQKLTVATKPIVFRPVWIRITLAPKTEMHGHHTCLCQKKNILASIVATTRSQ